MKPSLVACVLVATLLAGCTTDDNGATNPTWQKFTPDFGIAGQTAEPKPIKGVLPDGKYWGTVRTVLGTDNIVFELMQARFGSTCEEWAADNGMTEGCPNDYWVDDSDSQIISAENLSSVSVADQSGPGTSYRIDGSTLEKLVRVEKIDPPSGYTWVNFPFIVTIDGGKVVSADQFWVP